MIRAQVLEGSWQILGRDILPGVEPREVLPTWGPNGPESLGFTLYRSPTRVHAELRPYTPVEWYPDERADGPPLWSGYTMQAPPGGDSDVTSVTCHGWHFYREDRPGSALYVHDNLSEWVDTRSFLDVGYANFPPHLTVRTEQGAAFIGAETGQTFGNIEAAGITLDLGVGNLAKRVVVTAQRMAGAPGSVYLYVRGHGAISETGHLSGGGWDEGSLGRVDITATFAQTAGGSTVATTYTDSWRYVTLFVYRDAATYTATLDDMLKILGVKVFADTAYESGNASVFTADVGIKHARNTLCPLLSTDDSRIAAVTFPIRHSAWLREDSTARQRHDAWNDFHGYRLGVDAERRVFFQPQPSVPRLEVDASDFGVDYVATSTNDGTEVYNHVSVRGRSGSGEELRLDRWLSDYGLAPPVPTDVFPSNPSFDVDASGWTNATRFTGGGVPSAPGGGLIGYSGWPATASMTGGTFLKGRVYTLSMYLSLDGTGDGASAILRFGTSTDYGEFEFWKHPGVLDTTARVTWQPLADTAAASVQLSVQPGRIRPASLGAISGATIDTLEIVRVGGPLGMRNRRRSFTLNVSAATDEIALDALAEAWLLGHRSVPHKANLTVAGDAVTDLVAGRQVPANELGRYYGEMIRVLSVPDPDTGALTSRDGVIASVQGYAPASLALDSERRSLEALMARMGVVQGTA
jgi:hypothetical protein